MNSSTRILILPVAAAVIFGLCGWRATNPRQRGEIDQAGIAERRAAPTFELYNQDSKLVQLRSYLNRHRIVLVFYDGAAGPEANPVLRQLRDLHTALEREGIVVLGVSTELPQTIRKSSEQPFPFDLLSDVAAGNPDSAHARWGRIAPAGTAGQAPVTQPAVFFIDRTGFVAWDGLVPQPISDPGSLVSRLLSGE